MYKMYKYNRILQTVTIDCCYEDAVSMCGTRQTRHVWVLFDVCCYQWHLWSNSTVYTFHNLLCPKHHWCLCCELSKGSSTLQKELIRLQWTNGLSPRPLMHHLKDYWRKNGTQYDNYDRSFFCSSIRMLGCNPQPNPNPIINVASFVCANLPRRRLSSVWQPHHSMLLNKRLHSCIISTCKHVLCVWSNCSQGVGWNQPSSASLLSCVPTHQFFERAGFNPCVFFLLTTLNQDVHDQLCIFRSLV